MNASLLQRMAGIFFTISLISCILLLSGCWDRTEVNDLALVTAAGIDRKTEKRIELSVQVFIPRAAGGGQQAMGGGGSGSAQTFIRSAEGVTIVDAMTKLQEKLPRRIFWGHTEVFIIGRKLAEEGIRSHMDFMMRDPQVREGAYVFISEKEAKPILELLPPLERSSSEVLRELAKSKIAMEVTLKDLNARMIGDSEAVGLPWIGKLQAQPGQPEERTIPYITGTAVFKKDKLVGHISDRTTRGVLWLRNEIHAAVVTDTPKEAEGFVSMKLLRAESQLVPKIENGKWTITLRAITEDDIIQNATNLDLMNPIFLRQLEVHLEEDIQNRVQMALDQVQKKMNADIFDFAEAFHRGYPNEWNKAKERWDEIFPEVEVNFEVKAKVRRPGKSTVPAGLPQEEVKLK
ncbi:Ger(x)C family spore germination protein [Paenibacillus sedimenti]|uniref:Ger(X)C family spore germination protein n=1 Tax=Paenibacillus sedimenti TaxID=2770274 RepID=A0A926KMH3_9BACL|nr:Ger(x)C family spore germination protein [Paenibacillus sedimenti]MBD0379506.1 Ger(x)C family spore germination protein [Paenibacillus sedimenti]